MASPETKPNVCLMCLDAPAVGKLGICEHSYCESCLLTHIKNKGENEVITCPACQGQSLPGDPKVSKDETNVASAIQECGGQEKLHVEHRLQVAMATDQNKAALEHSNCKLCHHKGVVMKAVNMCKECKSIPLCGKCSQAHRVSKATQNHVVTCLALAIQRGEALCGEHKELTDLFCKTCSKTFCHVCVSLDHADHDIERFNNVVFVEFKKVGSALENEEKWLEMLKSDEKELQESKSTVQEMEDVLIKSIEDHAEKCIDEIIQNKEALKKQVRTDFEAIHKLLTKHLEAMPELQRTSGDVVAVANRLLNEQAELHLTYVEKLKGLKQQLDKLKEDHPAYEEDRRIYQNDFKDVCKKAIKFYPRPPNCKIGGFQDLYGEPRCDVGGPCVCETCERKADVSREIECRQKRMCTCGTCGCGYNREQLYGNGCCNKNNSFYCGNQITVRNGYFFP